ncbi:MAG: two-component regulator propeller domain-containing protein [Marinoscillum sp.]
MTTKSPRITGVFLTIAFMVCSACLTAQEQIKFAHLGTHEGLSHTWAICITKDSKGFLWVGTIHGANRYDGKTFKVFKSDNTNDNGLTDSFIQTIKEDSKGNIWVGTYSGGLKLFDRSTEKFESFRNKPKSLYSISDDRIHTIYEDSKGRLWIGTNRGLDEYDYDNQYFSRYHGMKGQPHFTVKGAVYAICEDQSGDLWVGTELGLYRIDLKTKKIALYENTPEDESSLSNSHVTSLYLDENKQMWIGTLGGGLNLYNPAMDSFDRFTNGSGSGLSHNSVLCLSGNQSGQLFIGTEGGGLNIMEIHNRSIHSYIPNHDQASINSNSIHSLFHDPVTQITWVGTYHGGINYFSNLTKPFYHYKSEANGLNNNNVLCFKEDQKSNLYVGTDGGGVNILNLKTNTFSYLSHSEEDPNTILSDAVLSMHISSKGDLWVGTFNGGLDHIQTNGQIKHYRYDPNDPKTLSGKDVSAIFEDKNKNLWIGTMKGGLNLFDPRTRTFERFQYKPGDPSSIRDNFISEITEDQNGKLLIQTGKSLEIFDPKTKTFERLENLFNIIAGMPIATIVDSKKNIWMGTREALWFFDPINKKFRTYTEQDGLPSSSITGVIEDENGHLWIGTMKGLVRFKNAINNYDQPDFQIYTVEDGLQGNDFKDLACFKGRDGTVYFGGQNGFNRFNPNDIKENPLPPPVELTGFKLFNQEVDFGEGQPIDKPIDEATEIVLSYKHNVFSIEFAALNFLLPQKNEYAYMMEGFERNWNFVENQNSATYTNLNPGNYTFRVKASNNDGVWNEQGTSIEIKILPPWWRTTWFQALCALTIILGIIAVFRIRLYQLKLRQTILKKQVAEATLEIQNVNTLLEERNEEIERQNSTLINNNQLLTKQNEELESQSKKIQKLLKDIQDLSEMKLRFFTNISHELRSPLTLIIGPLENLIARTIKNGTVQREYDTMHRNAVKLLQLINQLLDFRKIESGNISLHAHRHNIVSFSNDVFRSFAFLAEKKRIQYEFNASSDTLDLWFDMEKMEKIITNLLSNAFKFTPPGGKITFSINRELTEENQKVAITIADTGTGIAEDQIDKIFDLYYQAQNASNLRQASTGIGLALMRQYVDLHHGEIQVISQIGEGTTIIVKFKEGKGHLSSAEYTNEEVELYNSYYTSYELESQFPEIESKEKAPLWDLDLGESPTLLIVEDNHEIRHYIKEGLSGAFKIIEAEDGQEGLEQALEHLPDLIISDVRMPRASGFELCEQLKNDERTSHISVILLTAYSGEEKQLEGLTCGADDYMIKPFNINLLKQKIKNILSTRRHLIERFETTVSLDATKLATNQADAKFIRKAIEVIEENLSNSKFSVEDFSEHFRMSRRNLLRKIKTVSGLSVNEFLKNIRLKKSVQLLQDAEMNISEVAYAVGFSDPKYFSKCFKEQFGQSPSDYHSKVVEQ